MLFFISFKKTLKKKKQNTQNRQTNKQDIMEEHPLSKCKDQILLTKSIQALAKTYGINH